MLQGEKKSWKGGDEMNKDALKLLPGRANDNCFACSPRNSSGLKMVFHLDGQTVVSWLKVPDHLSGWDHIVHGGVIATMLDEIMGWAALHLLNKMTLTKSITVEFLKPVYVGKALRAEGKLLEIRNDREAVMQSALFNHDNELCSKATGTFALFTLEAMRKRGLVEEKILAGLEPILSGNEADTGR
jgi:uncharacterized protein (TIGR00369 family)